MAYDLAPLRAQFDLPAFAQQITKLRKVGVHWRGECPCCHGASKAPFQVSESPARWKCFSCDESGDIFNLYHLWTTGSPQIPGPEFPRVVKAAAAHFGITLPESETPRVKSEHERMRECVAEVWGAIAEHVTGELFAPDHPQVVRDQLVALAEHDPAWLQRRGVGILIPERLTAALDRLGVNPATRAAAGVSEGQLARCAPGLVLMRGGTRPSGMTSVASRVPVHMAPSGTKWGPTFLTDLPRGRMEDRHLVLGLLLPAALDAAARLERIRAAFPEDSRERKALSGIAICYHHADEPVDVAAYTRLTPRALILLPGVDDDPKRTESDAVFMGTRLIVTGTQWCAREVGVRVAELWERDRVEDLHEAREFFTWQCETWYADIGTRPGSGEARDWWHANVGLALAQMHDPPLRAVAAYRSRLAAGLLEDVSIATPRVAPSGSPRMPLLR